MHSVADLTTVARKTKGDIPPPLVGASTTVIGNKMYLFGGRVISLRRMVSDLYEYNMNTFTWRKIIPKPDEDVPGPRYFHSTDIWNNHLIVFGGMGYDAPTSDEPCVLSDIRFFSLETKSWVPATAQISRLPLPSGTPPPDASSGYLDQDPDLLPRARYAHLSSILGDQLFIIGGQDKTNVWLDDIHVYDLVKERWILRREFPRHCGTYRSVAVSASLRVRLPMEEQMARSPGTLTQANIGHSGESPIVMMDGVGERFQVDGGPSPPSKRELSNNLIHLPYSAAPTPEFPNDIFLYSNYNFTDVRRELEAFSPLPNGDFEITDHGAKMTGSSLPPGLRFPTGAILGTHLIISGTYLAHSYQSFSVWALDLQVMTWTRIDPGTTLTSGSWSRGVLWADENKFLIFGNRDGNLVEDYNRRLLNWDHVAYVDLEAFGIYQPPRLALGLYAQELGLAALEEGVLADFEIVCDDGRMIKCSRKALEDRWPWFKEQRQIYLAAAARALETIPVVPSDLALPILPPISNPSDTERSEPRPDPRLTPRQFHLSEPYPITLALLQYIYSLSLITPLQHAPAVLSALLLLSVTYKLPHLETLVKHAMHKALSPSSSVGVYEVATLCDSQSLQIRALKVVMSSSRSRRSERGDREQPGRSDRDRDRDRDPARPRGMSDAPARRFDGGSGNVSGSGHYTDRSINGAAGHYHKRNLGPSTSNPVEERETGHVLNSRAKEAAGVDEDQLVTLDPGLKAEPVQDSTRGLPNGSYFPRRPSAASQTLPPSFDNESDLSEDERERADLLAVLDDAPVPPMRTLAAMRRAARPLLKVSTSGHREAIVTPTSKPGTAGTIVEISSPHELRRPLPLRSVTLDDSKLSKKTSGELTTATAVSSSKAPGDSPTAKAKVHTLSPTSSPTNPSSSHSNATIRPRKGTVTIVESPSMVKVLQTPPAAEIEGSSYFHPQPDNSPLLTSRPAGPPSPVRRLRQMLSLSSITEQTEKVISRKSIESLESKGNSSLSRSNSATSSVSPPLSPPMTSASDSTSAGLTTPVDLPPAIPSQPSHSHEIRKQRSTPHVAAPENGSHRVPWHERIVVGPAQAPMYMMGGPQGMMYVATKRPRTAGSAPPRPPRPSTADSSLMIPVSTPTTPPGADNASSSTTFISRRFLSATKLDPDVIKARKKAEKAEKAAAEKEKKGKVNHSQGLANELFGLQPALTNDRKKRIQEQQTFMAAPVGAIGGFGGFGMGHYYSSRPQPLHRSTAARPQTAV